MAGRVLTFIGTVAPGEEKKESEKEKETSAEKTCVICMHKKYDTVFTK